MNKGDLTMIVRHEINEQEMIDIFDQFAGSIIDGYPCEEITEYLHEAVRELAVDQTIDISKGDFTPLLKDFISCFSFDGKNGRYLFRFEGLEFYGNTKVIKTEGGAMNKDRSKAYRDMWDSVYHIARAESFNDKYGHENSTIYITKYMLKAVHTSVNSNAVEVGDAIKMVEQAIELTDPKSSEKPPTQSELRRFELEQKACIAEKRRIHKAFIDLLYKSKHAISPRDMWKFFYRAQRFGKLMPHHCGWIFDFDLTNDKTRHEYTPKMKKCASNIFYPVARMSKSGERRLLLKLKSTERHTSCFGQLSCSDYSFDDELPF